MNETKPPGLAVDVELRESIAVVSANGEVDLATASQLSDGIEQAMSKSPSAVVVDLSEVSFLASVGMSVLITARRKASNGAQLLVVADGPYTRRPMELVGLDTSIPLFTDVAAAIASISGPTALSDSTSLPDSTALSDSTAPAVEDAEPA